jgi:hypothetical protein
MKKYLITLFILKISLTKILPQEKKRLILSEPSEINFRVNNRQSDESNNQQNFSNLDNINSDRNLLQIPKRTQQPVQKDLKPFEQRVLRKIKEERGVKRFVVPKGMRPNSHRGRKLEGDHDDPTAAEKKLESIPLMLFGDYEVIIEKK